MTRRETITVSDMTCTGCEQAVENALQNVEGVRKAEADNESGTIEVVTDDASPADLGDAVRGAGFEVES